MDLGLEGRVAVVAASSKGLGRAAADALAAEGVRLVISGRGDEALAAAEEALRAKRRRGRRRPADVTDPAAPERLVSAAVEHFGRLDIVVPNAGGPPPGRALELDDDAILAAVQANLLTSVRFVRAALPHLTGAGWGRICCIASSTIVQASPTLALSNTARTGLWAWAKTAAADLRGTGVTLNLACPGLPRHRPHDRARRQQRPVARWETRPTSARSSPSCARRRPRNVNGARIVVDGGDSLAL